MAERSMETMTPEAFLAWCLTREEAYELVDGVPRAMTGATRQHDRVVTNLIAALVPRLRGGPCRAQTDDVAVVTPVGNVRRPDVTIDCGGDGKDVTAHRPVVIVEVLSDGTSRIDIHRKTAEYKQIAFVRVILLVDPDTAACVMHVRRDDRNWQEGILIGADTLFTLPEVTGTLRLGDLYE